MTETITPGKRHSLLAEQLGYMEELQRRANGNRLARYRPYAKQLEFHRNGRMFRERLLKAGNQLGKTWSAAYETAMHLCGRYPDWWPGWKIGHAARGWAAGVTNEVTRDSLQLLLCGDVTGDRRDRMGTGAIPRDAIRDFAMRRGLQDAVESILVRWGGGGDVQAAESVLNLKSYEQGREKFQAATLDFVWLDEEPDLDIYTECLTRTNATDGRIYTTFTPLKGMSDTVKRFLIDKTPGTAVTTMTIHDAEHYTPEQRVAIIASYPAHEREARVSGTPTLGSGRIFPVVEETITVEDMPIPDHWRQLGGIDFGWDHPSGAACLAWDMDTDVIYVTKVARERQVTPLIFAEQLKGWGSWLRFAWPHDGLQHDKGSGEQIKEQYKAKGLRMLDDKATHPPEFDEPEGSGGNSVEAGLVDMLDRMMTGRWKVFRSCGAWFEEFRMYHRKDGKIVKLDDDVLSASRYAYMMRRFAGVKPRALKPMQQRSRMLT